MELDVLVLRSQDFQDVQEPAPAQEGVDGNELADMVKPEMLKDSGDVCLLQEHHAPFVGIWGVFLT